MQLSDIDFNKGAKLKDAPLDFYNYWDIPRINSPMFISDAIIKNTPLVMYQIFNINGHEVLLVYKFFKIIKVQFVRLLHFPITKPRNIELETKLLNLFSKHPQIQDIATSEDDYLEHKINIPSNADILGDDFFDNLDDEMFNKVNKGKRKSKIKYTKYKDRIGFRKAVSEDYFDIINIMDKWMQNKLNSNALYNKKTFNNVRKNFQTFLQEPFNIYVTTFDDEILQYEVLCKEGDKIVQLVNQAYPSPDDLPFDEVLRKEVWDYCLKWNHMLTINEFINSEYKRLEYEYSMLDRGLHTFKSMMYSNKKRIYLMKFKKNK